MKYLAIILAVVSAMLLAAAGNSQIVFQGTVNKPDGTPYWGQVKVGIRLVTNNVSTADILDNNSRTELLNVANGSYSMVIPFTSGNLDTLVNLSNSGNYYLQIYMASSNILNNDLFNAKDVSGSLVYKLTPNVQVLAAPVALTARGIYMNLTNSTWRVGETYKSDSSPITNGMIVGKKVGIGTNYPNAMLSIVSVTGTSDNRTTTTDITSTTNTSEINKRAIYIENNNLVINSTGELHADKVWHARWQ